MVEGQVKDNAIPSQIKNINAQNSFTYAWAWWPFKMEWAIIKSKGKDKTKAI